MWQAAYSSIFDDFELAQLNVQEIIIPDQGQTRQEAAQDFASNYYGCYAHPPAAVSTTGHMYSLKSPHGNRSRADDEVRRIYLTE